MDANIIIEDLLERLKVLTKENAFLKANLQTMEQKATEQEKSVVSNDE